jgi:hypothetical protein
MRARRVLPAAPLRALSRVRHGERGSAGQCVPELRRAHLMIPGGLAIALVVWSGRRLRTAARWLRFR